MKRSGELRLGDRRNSVELPPHESGSGVSGPGRSSSQGLMSKHDTIAANAVPYPENLTLHNLLYFIPIPTLVYQTSYPRSNRFRVRWLAWCVRPLSNQFICRSAATIKLCWLAAVSAQPVDRFCSLLRQQTPCSCLPLH